MALAFRIVCALKWTVQPERGRDFTEIAAAISLASRSSSLNLRSAVMEVGLFWSGEREKVLFTYLDGAGFLSLEIVNLLLESCNFTLS